MKDADDSVPVFRVPIDGELDLHTFRANEIATLIPDYLSDCYEKKIYLVRIIHGKGHGTLRHYVHAVLSKTDLVDRFYLSPDGNWGATIVHLKAPHSDN